MSTNISSRGSKASFNTVATTSAYQHPDFCESAERPFHQQNAKSSVLQRYSQLQRSTNFNNLRVGISASKNIKFH